MAGYFTRERLLEAVAVICSILYTVLITYEIIWCWSFAIIASILFIYLVYRKKLLAETVLHIFYLLAAVYGWVTWGSADGGSIQSWGIKNNLLVLGCGFLLTGITGFTLKRYSPAALPYVDAFTTVFSILATYMMAHRILENWLYWIVIDSISVFMYARRDLHLGALLYVIYTILAVNGYLQWLR
ncbi:MAG: nicotinamide mononucleotide transporter [Chitinophagales bacterium]|nr:MAG: nicotinamide mononucleotide transporter [Chitinophagales bacterium]